MRPLAKGEMAEVSAALGDVPAHVLTKWLLSRGEVTAYGGPAGEIAAVEAGEIDTIHLVGPSDSQTLAEYARSLTGRVYFQAPAGFEALLSSLREITGCGGMKLMVLDGPPRAKELPLIEFRLLGPGDEKLVRTLPGNVDREFARWGSVASMLRESSTAGAMCEGGLICYSQFAAETDKWLDIAVFTSPGFRGLGVAGATTAHLIREASPDAKKVVWNVDDINGASLRVAEKLGFKPHSAGTWAAKGFIHPAAERI